MDGTLERRRAPGKLRDAGGGAARASRCTPQTGIGHTRWATHGAPTERNAHPHIAGRVAVVHNGIIENFAELKAELIAKGRMFESETDTEVVAHLIDQNLDDGLEPAGGASRRRSTGCRGAYALGVLVDGRATS